MIKAIKYKIKPNNTQRDLLQKFFGCARFIYNWGLNIKTQSYKENGTQVNYVQLAKQLTQLKKQDEYTWLNETTSESLQQSLRNLESAFTNFFRKNGKYPRFKSKRNHKDSVKFINSVHFDFDKWKVKLPKLGWITLCKNTTFDLSQCKQGTCTVSKDCCGTYWCTIIIDDNKERPSKTKMERETSVGIDLGIKDYAILSDGTKYGNPKFLEKGQRKLAKLQRKFAKTKKDSKRHEAMRLKVARQHRNITNRRIDFIHKLTTMLVNSEYNTFCLENLNIEGMMKNPHLAKSIQSVAWSEFVRQLTYKCDNNGKNILFIGRFEPSSKMCHKCGYINRELTLSDREWICPQCGEVLDRDVNAAMNILSIAYDNQNLIGK